MIIYDNITWNYGNVDNIFYINCITSYNNIRTIFTYNDKWNFNCHSNDRFFKTKNQDIYFYIDEKSSCWRPWPYSLKNVNDLIHLQYFINHYLKKKRNNTNYISYIYLSNILPTNVVSYISFYL